MEIKDCLFFCNISNLAINTSNNMSLFEDCSSDFIWLINKSSTYLLIFLSKSSFDLILFLNFFLINSFKTSSTFKLFKVFFFKMFSVLSAILFSKSIIYFFQVMRLFYMQLKKYHKLFY